jgi:hypothetical protein
MNCVEVEFIPELGLIFRRVDKKEKVKIHEVKIETLEVMSLLDLEHCLSANSFMELEGMHYLFSDYLWGNDGKAEPIKKRDEPR